MNTFTLSGNLTSDPEIRVLPSGAAVASFDIAHTDRVKDGDEWKDGETMFLRCSVWRKQAENFVESAKKGDAVIVVGKLKQRSFVTKTGEKRTVMEMDVDTVGLLVTRGPWASQRSGMANPYGQAASASVPVESNPF
jgi:single-strand DNA-binding protein